MHRIAVISDTHNLLRPEVAELIETCDIYRDVYEAQNKAGAEADFDTPEGIGHDPLSQRFDPAFANELPVDVRTQEGR